MKILIMILFFLTISLLYMALLNLFISSKKRIILERMERYFPDEQDGIPSKFEKKKRVVQFGRLREKVKKFSLTKEKNNKLELKLYRAGVPLKPEEYMMFSWIAGLLGAGVLFLIVNHVAALPVGLIVGLLLPRMVIEKKQRNRLKEFNDQLPDMIISVIAALKAGFSFPQALKSVMEEAKSPMKEELAKILKEMQYGSTTEDALHRLYERMPSEDLDLMIQAVLIQRQVGGNLATVLQKIVETIKDRVKIQGQISTLTAQGRLSGMIIGLLPAILGLALSFIEPEYIGQLFSNPIGVTFLVIAVISSAVGFVLIRKITTIEV
ncbi:type II secretion system F family protein [Ornithinibacillus californiensis]|uniref:type II secretion system F family protein n=1 Tax=Ornithinibacillus californiensis TaxID=161536 RepID=UPI00064DD716|nr:type II secretion system F family protein [Ornithinibacillus californiensis]